MHEGFVTFCHDINNENLFPLYCYCFSHVWTYPASVDLNKFPVRFKERALDVFKQN